MQRHFLLVLLVCGTLFGSVVFAQDEGSDAGESGEQAFNLELSSVNVVDGRVDAEIVARNAGQTTLRLLIWDTPFEGMVSEDFRVKRDGEDVEFLGLTAKRGEPLDEDWLTLEPGEQRTAVVNLAEAFDFSGQGSYEVEYTAEFQHLGGDSEVAPRGEDDEGGGEALEVLAFEPQTKSLSILEDSGVAAPEIPNQVATRAGTPSYHDCSEDEENTVKAAHTAAKALAKNAHADLKANSSAKPSARYTSWFGTASYSTATDHFAKIESTLDGEALRFQCKPDKCKSTWFAYVYGSDASWNVYLCGSFWKAGTSGADSKGGTLVHEVSHFDKVADTDDIVYGQSSCKKLATDDPGKALKNADNHEYFSENP